MNKITMKFGVGIATAALFAMTASSAFADTTVSVTGNGASSINNVSTTNVSSTTVTQTNYTEVGVEVDSSAKTGGNSADGNTGGSTTVTSGNATSNVTVGVDGSSNVLVPSDCGCNSPSNTNITIKNNGKSSINSVSTTNVNTTSFGQGNLFSASVGVGSYTKTGKNSASENTGGSTNVTSGNANSKVNIQINAPSNIFSPIF